MSLEFFNRLSVQFVLSKLGYSVDRKHCKIARIFREGFDLLISKDLTNIE